jgi:hypothetical protein
MLGNAVSARQKIVDLILRTKKEEIDATTKVIDKRKELLNKVKDFYSWDKSLKDKTNDIALLEKQKRALEGLTDSESRMRLQKINQQLAESRQNLDDMIRDHSIELQIQGLDDLQQSINEAYEKYVKELNSNLDSITNAVSGATDQVTKAVGSVEQTISTLLNSYGVSDLDKDSIRYTRQYGVLPDSTVPADVIQLPDGSVLTPVSGGSAINNNASKVIDSFLNNHKLINGLGNNYLKDPNAINKLANVGTYQIGIDHMTYNFNIGASNNPEDIMNAIRGSINVIAKDVINEIGKGVSKIGLKSNYNY